MKADELLQMKEDIEASKLEIAKLEGQEENLENELQKVLNTKDIEQAIKITKKIRKKLEEKNTKLKDETKRVSRKYPW